MQYSTMIFVRSMARRVDRRVKRKEEKGKEERRKNMESVESVRREEGLEPCINLS